MQPPSQQRFPPRQALQNVAKRGQVDVVGTNQFVSPRSTNASSENGRESELGTDDNVERVDVVHGTDGNVGDGTDEKVGGEGNGTDDMCDEYTANDNDTNDTRPKMNIQVPPPLRVSTDGWLFILFIMFCSLNHVFFFHLTGGFLINKPYSTHILTLSYIKRNHHDTHEPHRS
jgi:hypothetical protein